jgi:ATP synthase protein I
MRRITRASFFFLSLGCIGWALRPEWKPIFGGFLIGVIGGLLGYWHLAWKVSAVAARAASGSRIRSGFGFITRAAIGLLAAVVSVRMLAFNVVATAAGLIALPLATLVLGLFTIRRLGGRSEDERGEKR